MLGPVDLRRQKQSSACTNNCRSFVPKRFPCKIRSLKRQNISFYNLTIISILLLFFLLKYICMPLKFLQLIVLYIFNQNKTLRDLSV